ncbi:MAG: hypothetical protein H7145_15885 [Akkermansiaceae bacterium]|nr:hypothetical protein [Armatimonadota bacterium]
MERNIPTTTVTIPSLNQWRTNSAPHPKSGVLEVSTTGDWNSYALEFVSLDNYALDKSHTIFHLGIKKLTRLP